MKESTVIRNLRRQIKDAVDRLRAEGAEKLAYRHRLHDAEREVARLQEENADWKRRFDLLLEKCGLPTPPEAGQ